MNYLTLCNQVLQRLRENTITADQLNSDPYYRVIGAAVNDAKNTVEDSWQWSQLRNYDVVQVAQGDSTLVLPNSADVTYVIKTVQSMSPGYFLREAIEPWFKARYVDSFVKPVDEGKPWYFGPTKDDATTGNKRIQIYPPANGAYTLLVDRVRHQDPLEAWDDNLLVPPLPVYTLATALASRERGEVGGTPTNELFGYASVALSDAIAYDSARFPEEMDWWGGNDRPQETNLRYL